MNKKVYVVTNKKWSVNDQNNDQIVSSINVFSNENAALKYICECFAKDNVFIGKNDGNFFFKNGYKFDMYEIREIEVKD